MDAYVTTFVNPTTGGSYPLADSVFGGAWIRRAVANASEPIPVPKRGLNSSTLGQMHSKRGHPIISDLVEVGEGRRTRLLRMSLIEDALAELQQHMEIATLRQRLRLTSEYEKVEFELLAASAYARHGCAIVPNLGESGPEFEVKGKSGQSMWVECKRKDSKTQLEERMQGYRGKVDSELIHALKEEGLFFHINFHVLDDPTTVDPEALIRDTLELCRAGDWGDEIHADRIRIEAIKLGDFGVSIPEDVLQLFLSERLAMRTSQVSIRDGQIQPQVRGNPIQIQWIVPTDGSGRTRGLNNSIAEAASQLPESGPSVAYIDLNARDLEEAESAFDRANSDVPRLLSGQFRRLNYVVLTAIFPSATADGVEGWSFNLELFRQKKPRTDLPNDTPILGSTPHFERSWFEGEWLHDRLSAVPENLPVLSVPIPRRVPKTSS